MRHNIDFDEKGRPREPEAKQTFLRNFSSALGLLLLFGIPFHLGLKRLFANELVSAWKEVVQALGMIVTSLWVVKGARHGWLLVWSVWVLLLFFAWRLHGNGAYFTPSLEGLLLLGGGVVAGVAASLWVSGEVVIGGFSALTLAALAFIFSCGVLLNDVLNLTNAFASEQDLETPSWALREGIDRAKFTMESPMGAGQFLWLCSLLVCSYLLTTKKFIRRMACWVLLVFVSLAILKTGSRGPYVLLAISQMIFWGLLAWSGHTGAKRVIWIAPILVAMAIGFLALVLPRQSVSAYREILASTTDKAENSNALRFQRISEGFEVVRENWPRGLGLYALPIKYRVLRVNFESHPLGMLASLGAAGGAFIAVQYIVLTVGILMAIHRFRFREILVITYLAGVIPFFVYTFVFPIGQDRYGSILMWTFIGASLGIITMPDKNRRYVFHNRAEKDSGIGPSEVRPQDYLTGNERLKYGKEQ